MMDSVRDWAFSLCVASICGTIMNGILPECDLQKIFKTVYSVFFICCVISPIIRCSGKEFNIDFDMFKTNSEYTIEESNIFENGNKLLENEINEKTKLLLEKNEIEIKNISTKTNILEDGSIEIIDFNISIVSGDIENIKNIVAQEIGLVPEITILGENEDG